MHCLQQHMNRQRDRRNGTEEGDISRETHGLHTRCVTDFSWDYTIQTVLPNIS